jgi:hypothetical protein
MLGCGCILLLLFIAFVVTVAVFAPSAKPTPRPQATARRAGVPAIVPLAAGVAGYAAGRGSSHGGRPRRPLFHPPIRYGRRPSYLRPQPRYYGVPIPLRNPYNRAAPYNRPAPARPQFFSRPAPVYPQRPVYSNGAPSSRGTSPRRPPR